MAAGGRLTGLARTRSIYTGEPVQYASDALRDHRHLPLLPDADGEQAVLEAAVMEELGRGGQWWAHPVGIAGTRLAAGYPLVVLDNHSELREGHRVPTNDHVLHRLLPAADPGVQVGGVLRLRVAEIDRADLHLKLVNTGTRLVLRGTSGTRWRQLLAVKKQGFEEAGLVPLWDKDELSSFELDDEREYASLVRTGRELAWLGSGLLRRIGLFHNVSHAYSTSSWITGDEWIFELDTRRDVALDHDGFLRHLMDEIWGLPLKIVDRYCHCGEQWTAGAGYQCVYYLRHRHGGPGVMQIRFRWADFAYTDDVRERLEAANASKEWLDKVLPRRFSRLLGAHEREDGTR